MKNHNNVKRMAIILTSLFIIAFEYVRHTYWMPKLHPNVDIILSSTIFILAAIIFSHFVFSIIKNIEKRRQQEEREAKALFDNSIDGIFVFNRNRKLVDMNFGAVQMSNWKMDEVIGKHTIDSLFHLDYPIELNHFLDEAKSSMKIDDGMLIKKSGEKMSISVTFTRIPNERKEEEKIAVIVRDLTERKQMEDIIKGLYKEASQKQLEAEMQYRIARKVASLLSFTEENRKPILEAVANDIKKLLVEEFTAIFLYDFDKEGFDLIALTDFDKEVDIQTSFKQHIKATQTIEETGIRFIPLQREETLLGYLVVGYYDEASHNLHKQELINSITNLLSISFENWYMNHRLKDIAILEERERLAREMHDGIAQEIVSIQLRVEYLKHLMKEKALLNNASVMKTIDEINKIVYVAHHEVRHNLFNLRTIVNENESLIQSIEKYIEKFNSQNNIMIELKHNTTCKIEKISLSDYTMMHVMRVMQEALNNVRRHAFASKVEISLECENDKWSLTIQDDGIGFSLSKSDMQGHYGLITMKERAKLIEGELKIDTNPGEGVRIIMTVPVKEMIV